MQRIIYNVWLSKRKKTTHKRIWRNVISPNITWYGAQNLKPSYCFCSFLLFGALNKKSADSYYHDFFLQSPLRKSDFFVLVSSYVLVVKLGNKYRFVSLKRLFFHLLYISCHHKKVFNKNKYFNISTSKRILQLSINIFGTLYIVFSCELTINSVLF